MRRSNSASSPLPVLLLVCFFHLAAAARVLPATTAAVPRLHHQQGAAESDAMAVAADGLVLQEAGDGSNGDAVPEVSEMMGSAEEEAACQEEGNGDDECMQRRLLHDAHLDYIYTQHKGKP